MSLTDALLPRRIRYPWLRRAAGAHWPRGESGNALLRRLNRTARACQSRITITSGRRGPYDQWVAYQDYLRGGILAAPCCSRHWPHAWANCLRQCASNHCANRAADCVIDTKDGMKNIGEVEKARRAMRANGLCLPVGSGETWHVEVGDVWNS